MKRFSENRWGFPSSFLMVHSRYVQQLLLFSVKPGRKYRVGHKSRTKAFKTISGIINVILLKPSLTNDLRNTLFTLVQSQMFKMFGICVDAQFQPMFKISINFIK